VWKVVRGLPSDRLAVAMQKETDRMNAEDYRRLYAEAASLLDFNNQNPNAQYQIVGELVGNYFPAQVSDGAESWWTYSLGWARADQNSAWEPTIALQPHQRWS
jgi:hypothetical protein